MIEWLLPDAKQHSFSCIVTLISSTDDLSVHEKSSRMPEMVSQSESSIRDMPSSAFRLASRVAKLSTSFRCVSVMVSFLPLVVVFP